MSSMRKSIFGLVAMCLLPSTSFAQSEADETQQFIDLVNSTMNQVVNGSTLFSSQNGVSSGYFTFKSTAEDGPDARLEVLRIPAAIYLDSDKTASIRPFVTGLIGAVKLVEHVEPFDERGGEDDFSRVSTLTVGVGGGADFSVAEGLVITPMLSASYSRITNDYDYNNPASIEIAPFIDGEVFNWDIDVVTITPEVGIKYEIPVGSSTITPNARYAYLINDSISSSSDIIDVNSETGLFQVGLEALVPTGVELYSTPIGVRPYFVRSEVHGEARVGLGFSEFYEAGTDIVLSTEQSLGLFSSVSVGTSYTWASDFEGWRVGVTGKF